ncbi:MAG: DNA polymerase III subunit delta [Bacteroidales bacterium]|nr:DNA polymerase III subunit delta [Bacteroidales bacterium]
MAVTEKQLIEELKKGNFKPVYLLTGEENYYIDVVSNYFEEQVIDPSVRDFDQTVLYGRDVDMATVVSTVKRYPMMSPIHLVIVKEAQDIDVRQWDRLAAYLQQPSDRSVLVLCYRHKKFDKRTAVYKAIDKAGVIFESPKVYDNQVPAWIMREVGAHGYSISDKAAAMMAENIGVDLGKIANELSKLYPLLPQGGTIDEQLVEDQIGISKDYNVFELQKAIGRRDPVMCNRIINHFAANPKKNPIQMMLPLLYGYFLKIMFYHQLENKSDAPKVLGCAPSFVQDYALAARNYPLGKLATCIGYLYETDLRSKGVRNSGNVTDGELLKELIFKVIH